MLTKRHFITSSLYRLSFSSFPSYLSYSSFLFFSPFTFPSTFFFFCSLDLSHLTFLPSHSTRLSCSFLPSSTTRLTFFFLLCSPSTLSSYVFLRSLLADPFILTPFPSQPSRLSFPTFLPSSSFFFRFLPFSSFPSLNISLLTFFFPYQLTQLSFPRFLSSLPSLNSFRFLHYPKFAPR